MKYTLFLLCCIFLFTLRANSQDKQENTTYIINGHFDNADGQKVTLINIDTRKKEAKVHVSDNSFHIDGQLTASPTIFALKVEGVDLPMLLVVGNGDTLTLSGSLAEFPLAEVNGNRQSKEMQQYQQEFLPFIKKAKSMSLKASSLSFRSDSTALSDLRQSARNLQQQMQTSTLAFIQYHPDALASLFALLKGIKIIPPQQLKHLYHSLSEEVRQSPYGKEAKVAIENLLATAIGTKAPEFTLKAPDGHPVNLSSFKGQYVLIDFWASWCGPCRNENPNVVAAYKKFKDQNFTILGVSLDQKKDRWTNAIQQDHLAWTQVSDLKGWNSSAARLYHVNSIPANFLLDPSGRIIAKDLRGQELFYKLQKVLE